jgi:hypothetical protein
MERSPLTAPAWRSRSNTRRDLVVPSDAIPGTAIVRCRVVLSTVHFQLMCGPGPSAASSTAARHSRLTGRTGGIGAVSGTSVGAAIETMRFDSVFEALRMNVL